MDERNHGGSLSRPLTVAAVVLLVGIAALSGTAAAHGGDAGTHHHDGWMGTHAGGLGFLWMLVWALVLVGLPLYAGYVLLTRQDAADEPDDALDVLRRRYAAGDIDDDEFETRRQTLLDAER